jgi:hypothetical protein
MRSFQYKIAKRFGLSVKGAIAVEVAFASLDGYRRMPGWSADNFEISLCHWLIEQKLLPAHVSQVEFQQAIKLLTI